MRVPRLVLLNGMPGIGKSTLADRLAGARPGCVVLDADRIWRATPGYPSVPVEAARGRALARAATHLGDGEDVVMPQLVARVDQVERFADMAFQVGARFVHVLLVDARSDPVGRFHRRSGDDPWHADVRALVERQGGDDALARYQAGLADVVATCADVHVVPSLEGDADGTRAALVDALART